MDRAADEKRQIQENQPPDLFRREKTLFLVSAAWWKSWTAYVCYDEQASPSSRPGPIDNSPLLTQPWTSSGWLSTSLRSDLQEHRDFEYLSNVSWRKLLHWYQGDPAVEVFVVNGEVDLSPVMMLVWAIETKGDYDKPKEAVLMSERITVGQAHKYLCDRLSLSFYKYSFSLDCSPNPDKNTVLSDLSKTSPLRAYIHMKSVLLPVISLPVHSVPEARKSPSSHGDTQDDSDFDMDSIRPMQRSDREEIAARIAAKKREVRLTVQDIGATEKSLRLLWMLQEKDGR